MGQTVFTEMWGLVALGMGTCTVIYHNKDTPIVCSRSLGSWVGLKEAI